MKKEFKKKIELELTEAINKTLAGHNNHALAKAKKVVKAASKAVAKKFVKTLKALAEKKKDSAKNKKVSPKVAVKIATAKRDRTGKFVAVKPSSNGVHRGSKHKITLSGGKGKVSHSITALQRN